MDKVFDASLKPQNSDLTILAATVQVAVAKITVFA
jgi:hypothetical protein